MSRIVLVTGGTGALGKVVADTFLAAGDTVLITDLRGEQGELKTGLTFFQADVTAEADLKNISKQIQEEYGHLDVLVNVAGGFSMSGIENTTMEELERMININLKSAFVCSKTLLPLLKESENGRIISIAARGGLKGVGGMGPYCISKAGVISLIESLADELKNTKVTANAVLPSIIDTPANRKDMPTAAFEKWVSPEALAKVIFFLASNDAGVISGASIPVYNKA